MESIKTVRITNKRNVLVQIPSYIIAKWNPSTLNHLEVLYDEKNDQVCVRPCIHRRSDAAM